MGVTQKISLGHKPVGVRHSSTVFDLFSDSLPGQKVGNATIRVKKRECTPQGDSVIHTAAFFRNGRSDESLEACDGTRHLVHYRLKTKLPQMHFQALATVASNCDKRRSQAAFHGCRSMLLEKDDRCCERPTVSVSSAHSIGVAPRP